MTAATSDRRDRATNIICTVGPATHSFEMLEALYHAGMDIVRLNMSHANHDSAAEIIRWVRTLNRKVRYPVGVLLDTQGPEIRTGVRGSDLNLQTGDVIQVTVRGAVDVEQTSIQVNYDDLVNAVAVGDRITVDNGLINLEILGKEHAHLTCKVLDGGVLGSKRHVNLPGIRVNLPAITEKDAEDIRFGVEHDVDFIALSFVRRASDIEELHQMVGGRFGKIRVIAKIEDAEGVQNVESIAAAADGIMVARGDLGVEINICDLPNVQREIVRTCARLGRRVIVATHLLESMIQNPIPTRAEVTDVANAVYEEVDAVMLSGETSVGRYPVRCVEQLVSIARASEKFQGLDFTADLDSKHDKQQLAVSAVHLAENLGAVGIVVFTRRGFMADFVTNCHPRKTRIFALTNDSRTRRRLVLNRNLVSHRMNFSQDPEATLQRAFHLLKEREGLVAGDKVVVISDVLAGQGVDAIQIRDLN